MMLHEKSLKDLLLKRVETMTKQYTEKLGSEDLLFEESINEYVGIKIHHGYPFLFDVNKRIVYPRGLGNKMIMEIYLRLKDRKIYCKNTYNGLTYKTRPKKNK